MTPLRSLATGWIVAFTALVMAGAALAAPNFPERGRSPVVDQANILSPESEATITREAEELNRTTGRQFVVLTVSSLQGYEIEDYGNQLIRHWRLGSEREDNGAILIVAPTERKVRIEVGYGLEPILTDALSRTIIQRAIIPHFRSGDMEQGVVAGAHAVVQQLSLSETEAVQKVEQAERRSHSRSRGIPWWAILIIIFVVMSIVGSIGGGGGGGGGGRRRRHRGDADWITPMIIGGMIGRGSSGWGSGGGSSWGGGGGGGWGGGGGFSGGGGSGGGGGATGSW